MACVLALLFITGTGGTQNVPVAGFNLAPGIVASSDATEDGNVLPKTIQKRQTAEECTDKVKNTVCVNETEIKHAGYTDVMVMFIEAVDESSELGVFNDKQLKAFCNGFPVYILCHYQLVCKTCGSESAEIFFETHRRYMTRFDESLNCTKDNLPKDVKLSCSIGGNYTSNKATEAPNKPSDSPKDNTTLTTIIIVVVVFLSILALIGGILYLFIFVKKGFDTNGQSAKNPSTPYTCLSKSTTGGNKSAKPISSTPSIRSKM